MKSIFILSFVAGLALAAAGGEVARAEPQIVLPPQADPAAGPAVAPPPAAPADGAPQSATMLGGYGELTLNALQGTPAIVDLRRVVVFVGHRFSEHFRFNSEIEVEHAVASSADRGEVEIEQAYLDWMVSPRLNVRGGVVLLPVGLINMSHESPTFNAVDRPEVDLLVIPSTWREPAVGIFGELCPGLRYHLYLVDGLDANGFTAAASVRDGHQEAEFARAGDFGAAGRLSYEPHLGTELGGAAYHATSGNSLRGAVGRVPVTIVEADARTRLGRLSGRGEVAVQLIGDAAALDTYKAAGAVGSTNAVSARSQGAYAELGYDVLVKESADGLLTLTGFARYDYVDTQADVPAGFIALPQLRQNIATVGLVLRPIQDIALKLDGRRHWLGDGSRQNEVAAAIAWMF
jgi:hypothetical protein